MYNNSDNNAISDYCQLLFKVPDYSMSTFEVVIE